MEDSKEGRQGRRTEGDQPRSTCELEFRLTPQGTKGFAQPSCFLQSFFDGFTLCARTAETITLACHHRTWNARQTCAGDPCRLHMILCSHVSKVACSRIQTVLLSCLENSRMIICQKWCACSNNRLTPRRRKPAVYDGLIANLIALLSSWLRGCLRTFHA